MSVHYTSPRGRVESVDNTHFIIGAKVKALKAKAHEVLVDARHAWPLYVEAKEQCRKIGAGTAPTYDYTLTQLNLAATGDEQAWREVIRVLCPNTYAAKMARQNRLEELKKTVKATFSKRPDILYHARSRIEEIARKGGSEYDRVLDLVKWAQADLQAHVSVMEIFFPQAAKKLAVQPVR